MNYKKLVIVGGSSEISYYLVSHYYNEFDKIILFVRTLENNIVKKINKEFKDKIDFIELDIKNLNLGLGIISRFSPDISGLIWISGFTGLASEEYNNPDLCKTNLEINLVHPIILINTFSKKILKKDGSFISVFTSVAGIRGRKKQLIYGSAKSGLITYLSGLRQQLHKDNILVQTIIPGYMNTKPFREGDWKSPSFLIEQPEKVAQIIKKGVNSKKNIIYVNFFWKIIMRIINFIPENIFKKLNF
jgi:decaprenylphospho-beta-D-erythro-pentofuranosid-2-ulose 2-reductase